MQTNGAYFGSHRKVNRLRIYTFPPRMSSLIPAKGGPVQSMIRLSNPFRIFFDYPTNDNTTAIISSVLPPLSPFRSWPYSLPLAQVDHLAPKASIIHSTDPLSLPPAPSPWSPAIHRGPWDRFRPGVLHAG